MVQTHFSLRWLLLAVVCVAVVVAIYARVGWPCLILATIAFALLLVCRSGAGRKGAILSSLIVGALVGLLQLAAMLHHGPAINRAIDRFPALKLPMFIFNAPRLVSFFLLEGDGYSSDESAWLDGLPPTLALAGVVGGVIAVACSKLPPRRQNPNSVTMLF